MALAAIKAGHRAAGQRFDAADPALQKVLAGNSRLAAREREQAKPLRPAILSAVLAGLDQQHPLDARDSALLSRLYVAALRHSEATGLDLDHGGDGAGILRVTDDGLDVVLLRSKTEQARETRKLILRDANPQAVAAIERWLKAAAIEPGTPVFRRIAPTGVVTVGRLSGDGACRAVKARMRRHYIGQGTDAETAERRSLEMRARYGEQAEQKRRAVHRQTDVGV